MYSYYCSHCQGEQWEGKGASVQAIAVANSPTVHLTVSELHGDFARPLSDPGSTDFKASNKVTMTNSSLVAALAQSPLRTGFGKYFDGTENRRHPGPGGTRLYNSLASRSPKGGAAMLYDFTSVRKSPVPLP